MTVKSIARYPRSVPFLSTCEDTSLVREGIPAPWKVFFREGDLSPIELIGSFRVERGA